MRQRESYFCYFCPPLSPLAAAKLSKLGQQCQEWSSTLEKVQQARAQERGQTERVITAKVDAESIYMYGLSCTHTFQLPCFLFYVCVCIYIITYHYFVFGRSFSLLFLAGCRRGSCVSRRRGWGSWRRSGERWGEISTRRGGAPNDRWSSVDSQSVEPLLLNFRYD